MCLLWTTDRRMEWCCATRWVTWRTSRRRINASTSYSLEQIPHTFSSHSTHPMRANGYDLLRWRVSSAHRPRVTAAFSRAFMRSAALSASHLFATAQSATLLLPSSHTSMKKGRKAMECVFYSSWFCVCSGEIMITKKKKKRKEERNVKELRLRNVLIHQL
jgi:hypothetical protein